MSFRGDDQRRYGHVPPVQYAVAGQQPHPPQHPPQHPQQHPQQQYQHHHQQPDQQAVGVGRRPSFNTGDDSAYYNHHAHGADGDLFSPSPAGSGGNPSLSRHASSTSTSALSGYQHQYRDPIPAPPSHATYNPQSFVPSSNTGFPRAQSAVLPHHPHPVSRFSTASVNPYNAPSPPASSYTPQAYNPAAYANTNAVPQRHDSYHGFAAHDQYGNTSSATAVSPGYGQALAGTYSSNYHAQPARSPPLPPEYRQSLPTSPSSFTPSYSQAASAYDPSHYTAAGGHYSAYGTNGGAPPYPTTPSSAQTQAPYPSVSHIPDGPDYAASSDQHLYYTSQHADSRTSPSTSPYLQPQKSPGLQRHPTNAPLPTRPMEDVPEESMLWDDEHDRTLSRAGDNERLMQDIEAELGGVDYHLRHRSPSFEDGRLSEEQTGRLRGHSFASAHTPASAITSPGKASSRSCYDDDDDNNNNNNHHNHDDDDDDDDDDDPEGTAGVLAMQQAELDDQRFSGNMFMFSGAAAAAAVNAHTEPLSSPPATEPEHDDAGEFGGMDLGMLSGGYAGSVAYGPDVTSPPRSSSMPDGPRPLHTPGYYNSLIDDYVDDGAFQNAEIDYGGTGGLQAPEAHRLSFDEGREERVSIHSHHSGLDSPSKDEYGDLFYHPGLSSRPLPALPPGNSSDSSSMLSVHSRLHSQHHQQQSLSLNSDARYPQAEGPEAYHHQSGGQQPLYPERSISLSGHSYTPPVQAPARSRTDAAEDRRKYRQYQTMPTTAAATHHGPIFSDYDSAPAASSDAFDGITLPSGRKKKFIPSKLTASDFNKCKEPWALSGIELWVRTMGDGELDLREKTIEEALTNLFVFKVPTMNVADAEALSGDVVVRMLDHQVLLPDEEWVKFGRGHISGVLWQLSGSGCYSPKVHEFEISGRCYAHHCTRTLKKIDLEAFSDEVKGADTWNVFYKLKKEDWESKPKKEVDRQNILHEIVTGEENYIKQLNIFRTLYRDDLQTRNPPIVPPDKLGKLLVAVFGKLDTVLRINKDHLLAQLKYRQQEQGPWVVGFSDLFREWIRKAKADYIQYASGYPRATYMVRNEAERNMLFRKFLEDKQRHKLSSKQDWTHFLITPLQRLQRYILLLQSVEHKMIGDSEEKTNLQKAIQEIQTVTHECDAKVAETNKRVQMAELHRMLVPRGKFKLELNLDHMGRVLIKEGELQRMGSKGMRWVDSHVLLFDHYLILSKASKDSKGLKTYDVSREPIPMPLLFLESMNDEPVMKQKGLTAPLGRTTAAPSNSHSNKLPSNGGRPGMEHSPSGSSSTPVTTTVLNDSEGKILYPFKVKHLGHELYTLYASSAQDRLKWCTSIIDAKARHAKALFAQNAEPFRLRVLADASFHYDAGSVYARAAGAPLKETPLDRAIRELESTLGPAQGIAPVCRAQVNCATGFSAFGKAAIAIGTDYGVYISDPANARGWTRSVQVNRVTQITVLEEFSVCLVIADKSLICYPLDVIAPFAPHVDDNPRRASQRLAKDVSYFATARMKDRLLVFYKRKEGLHTSFKVLEPIYHKATEKRSRMFGTRRSAAGSTDTFRDFDEFYLPTECYSLSIFQTYVAVSTSKGVEMLTLDKKQPMSIPDLKAPANASIAGHIRDQKPLGMFRLNMNEFILTYEACAVYVDKYGDVSRTLIMEYTGKHKKAKGATMYGQYLLLFNEDYVEVRNAENGRLRQIIAGRDVRVIDYGVRGPTGSNSTQPHQTTYGHNGQPVLLGDMSKGTVKIAMSHPELPGRQIVLEMLLNDGHSED
ncbi:hypothetical protein E4U43_007753 [Claviceps pusilla]|uniref:GDP/GTP exchange factor Rom2p n=1 Tax=Claviceps pusilla TaxID=123648 RepID=A0A9P7NC35_9HYPO|nr:hypothetical protein E4U43_007753 [Claviceps pusilla]